MAAYASTRRSKLQAAFAGLVGKAEKLAISKPEDGAVFRLVGHQAGGSRPVATDAATAVSSNPPYQISQLPQRIVCQVAGNPAGAKLWWFVDGRPAGESAGLQPMALPMAVGEHEITCSTEEGVSTTVRVRVEE